MSWVLQAVNKQGKQGDGLYAKRQSFASSPELKQPIPAGKLPWTTYCLVYWKVCGALYKNPPLAPWARQTQLRSGDIAPGLRLVLHIDPMSGAPTAPHLSYLTVQVSPWCMPCILDRKEHGQTWRRQQSLTKRIGNPYTLPCSQHLFPSWLSIMMESIRKQNASHKKHLLGSRLSHSSHKGLFP